MTAEMRTIFSGDYAATDMKVIQVLAELERLVSAFGYSLKAGLKTKIQRVNAPSVGVHFDVIGWEHQHHLGHIYLEMVEKEEGFDILRVYLSLPRWGSGIGVVLKATKVDPNWIGTYNYMEVHAAACIPTIEVERCLAKYREMFIRVR